MHEPCNDLQQALKIEIESIFSASTQSEACHFPGLTPIQLAPLLKAVRCGLAIITREVNHKGRVAGTFNFLIIFQTTNFNSYKFQASILGCLEKRSKLN